MPRLPDTIEDALRATGKPWSAEPGGKHTKIRLAGQFVGVVTRNAKTKGGHQARCELNLIAQIRRAARGQQ